MPGNRGSLRLSLSEFQEFQRNLQEQKNGSPISKNKPSKEKEDGFYNPVVVFITFRISDNRTRDIDGMVSTVLDCLVKSSHLEEDCRQIVPMTITDYEVCKKGREGFLVRIVKRECN